MLFVVWINDAFDKFTKYLKESCRPALMYISSFSFKIALVEKIFP